MLAAGGATELEAQTNNLMLPMLYDCAGTITAGNILFQDVSRTELACPRGHFRGALPADRRSDGEAPWVIEADGAIVGDGGWVTAA